MASDEQGGEADPKQQAKEIKKLQRRVQRAEEQLISYERLVDRTQHLLNTRIEEVEAARAELAARTQALEESEARFKHLANAAFEGILTHREGIVIDCNHAAEELYGCKSSDLIGASVLDRVHSAYREQSVDWLSQETDAPVEVNHLRLDGSVFPVEVRSRVVVQDGSEAMITVVRDITTFKEMEEQLRRIANSDALTGVANRRYFMEVGKRELFRAKRYGQPLALIMLDIDHFKSVNDTYGHDAGDEVIRALAQIGEQVVRESDVFARIGGEEFAVIVPNSPLTGALALAERLRSQVEATEVETAAGLIRFTISAGAAELNPDDNDIDQVLSRADDGLYQAKEGGRNRVCSGAD